MIALLVSSAGTYLISNSFFKDYASLFRNNREFITYLSPSNGIAAALSWYKHERTANLPLIRFGEDARQSAAHLTGKPTLTLLVVGETTRAQDVGLGGYTRQTTPLLAKDNVIYYPNTLSCGTSTAVSVPCMFSGMGHDHYNDALANHREGLLDIVQRAGVNVLWRENDGGCKGACARVPTEEMTAQNLPGMCIDGECYDQVLFHHLQGYIDKQTGNTLIVLHTIGSHGPTYNHRYPDAFKYYTPTCETNEVQHCSTEQLVNTYDNTIRYMDAMVDQGIQLLQANSQRFTTSLVYLCDAVNSLKLAEQYLHSSSYSLILLDLGLPDGNGLTLLKSLRRRKNTIPIIVLTARDTLEDRIVGLDSGADDYLVKPFALEELLARSRALIRRFHQQSDNLLQIDDLTIDIGRRLVFLSEQLLELTPKEYAILLRLMLKANQPVHRDVLYSDIYSWDNEPSTNSLEVHIHNLRDKVGKQRIQTLRGFGYSIRTQKTP